MPCYKNRFNSPKFIQETIVDGKNATIGTIRVKPSSVLWKESNKHQYYSVPLEDFIKWITSDEAKAKQVKS